MERFDRLLDERFKWVFVGLALVLAVGILFPTLHGSFYADDAWQSLQVQKLFDQTNTSLWQRIWDSNVTGVRSQGRILPFSTYVAVLFYLVNGSAFAYKAFLLCLTLVNLLLCRYLVVLVTKSNALGLAAMLMPMLVIQVRFTDDPITTFHGLVQVILMLTFVSLITLAKYLKTAKKGYLYASLAAYGVSMLTYEVGIPFFLLFTAFTWWYPRRRPLRRAFVLTWPYAALCAVVVALTMAVRVINRLDVVANTASAPYAPRLDVLAIVRSFFIQLSAAVPGSHKLADMLGDRLPGVQLVAPVPLPGPIGVWVSSPVAATLIAAGIVLLMVLIVRGVALESQVHPLDPKPLAAIGVCLLVLPILLTSLSPKYQTGIRWGIGYLPAYATWFGTAMLLLAALLWLLQRTGPDAQVAITTLACLGAVLLGVQNFGMAKTVTDGWATFYDEQRALQEDALGHGLLGPLDHAWILTPPNDWRCKEFYQVHASIDVTPVAKLEAPLLEEAAVTPAPTGANKYVFPVDRRVYMVEPFTSSKTSGVMRLSRVLAVIGVPGGRVLSAEVSPMAYFESADGIGTRPGLTPAAFGLEDARWKLEDSGEDWVLYRSDVADGL